MSAGRTLEPWQFSPLVYKQGKHTAGLASWAQSRLSPLLPFSNLLLESAVLTHETDGCA